jgi:hypothetical protein
MFLSLTSHDRDILYDGGLLLLLLLGEGGKVRDAGRVLCRGWWSRSYFSRACRTSGTIPRGPTSLSIRIGGRLLGVLDGPRLGRWEREGSLLLGEKSWRATWHLTDCIQYLGYQVFKMAEASPCVGIILPWGLPTVSPRRLSSARLVANASLPSMDAHKKRGHR